MPRRWLDGVSNLVAIDIMECHNCRVLPHLSRLPHLKTLFLARLYELEYVEDEDDIRVGGGKCGFGAHNVYFPSLEVLLLSGLRSLKGWTRPSMDDHGETRQLSFPRLLRLEVFQCPKLMSMSLAPKLESFRANRKLDITGIEDGPASLSISSRFFRLQNLKINDHQELTSLMIESSKSIRHLVVKGCKNISLGNLYVLETLIIHGVSDDLEEKLPQLIACVPMLQILGLERFRNLEQLPEEIGNLSLLRELKIGNCLKMAKLPQSLLSLTSLQKLHIRACPDLKKRYEKPNGQDCHLLQHISNVEFSSQIHDILTQVVLQALGI
uniref:Uncharacterized protein n=1 Tax=Chenopodium quinoa TaxID=63459 RepID=A0A803LBV4_CHEQI